MGRTKHLGAFIGVLGLFSTTAVFAQTTNSEVPSVPIEKAIGTPPQIKPGECYVRVRQPAKVESIEEKVLIKPEYVRYEIIPAEFKEVEKEIVVKPESVSYEIVPAVYETKEVEVVVAPEHTKIAASEPQFQSEETKREVKPAQLNLKIENNEVGELLSFLQEDAQYKTYARHLLIKPSQVQQEKVAKAVEKVTTQVLVKPAEVKEVKVPAEVKKYKVKELTRPATKKEVKVPAEYATITRQKLVSPDQIVWLRVVCASKITPEFVKQIQAKLKEKGVEIANDGALNDATKAAIAQYQTKNNLAVGGLTYPFLEHLGVGAP